MTTTEKTHQVPLTFKDNSTNFEKKSEETVYDTAEANQAMAMTEIIENEMPDFTEGDDLAVQEAEAHPKSEEQKASSENKAEEIEEMEMGSSVAEEEAAVATPQAASNISLPAALVDEELLTELAQIPDKMGFKIGDVAELLGIKAYVLRYWETEFDMLKPKKAANNQRYYTKKNVENAFLIRKLLHRDRFSIEGARAALRDLKSVVKKEKDWNQVTTKMHTLEERVDHLLVDLKQLRNLFVQ